eukprot:3054764-Amphidinium_carterae.2
MAHGQLTLKAPFCVCQVRIGSLNRDLHAEEEKLHMQLYICRIMSSTLLAEKCGVDPAFVRFGESLELWTQQWIEPHRCKTSYGFVPLTCGITVDAGSQAQLLVESSWRVPAAMAAAKPSSPEIDKLFCMTEQKLAEGGPLALLPKKVSTGNAVKATGFRLRGLPFNDWAVVRWHQEGQAN